MMVPLGFKPPTPALAVTPLSKSAHCKETEVPDLRSDPCKYC